MSRRLEIQENGMLKFKKPFTLPEVLDVLIVGGGPGGTAAAFRAKELGLSALVIDLDDIMRRIRDYAKGKPILPGFGGGDGMKFPKGGKLVSLLNFPPIDKDEMFNLWKRYYYDFEVPAQVGVEFTGIEAHEDGVWKVKAWNTHTRSEQQYLAKHVVIAIGRGFPRRFDIPGNTMDIAYRLSDAGVFVGEPACVIGGGTSAAEAVIAISNAKVQANDTTAVYWSYRGDKLPKVSQALASEFFGAYVGNGNVLYFPRSEPAAVVTAEDSHEYLSIRTDRKFISGRPNECAHIEFLKENCVACIGEDIPEKFLNSLGIFMAVGGKNNKKRMVVNSFLETQQKQVYFVGDILSQAYFYTEDFAGDPQAFEEIKHRGNIKAAVVDGVYVAEVIAQRLQGKQDSQIEVALEFVEDRAGEGLLKKPAVVKVPVAPEAAGPPDQSFLAERAPDNAARLVRLLPGNVEENEYPLRENATTTLGRNNADITFSEDTYMAESELSITHNQQGWFVRDDGSANGIFLKAREGLTIEVESGDLIRLGRQFLLFSRKSGKPGFVHYDSQGKAVKSYELKEKTIVLGRDAPDVILDKKDTTLSRRHIALSNKENRIFIRDLKSVNGSWLKVRKMSKLTSGDIIRAGQQVFSFSEAGADIMDSIYISRKLPAFSKSSQAARASAARPKATPPASAESMITFEGAGKSCPLVQGKTICELAEELGLSITAECHAGICGSDPIQIISGENHLNPPGDAEKEALEEICDLKPGQYRLACMAKPKGAVTVKIL